MKITSTSYFLLDIMLCAVGCLLLILLASLIQERAPGENPKPLSIFISATGTHQAFREIAWGLESPRKGIVDTRLSTGIAISPANQRTVNGESCCYLVAKADQGNWILFASLLGGRENASRHTEFVDALPQPVVELGENELLSNYTKTLEATFNMSVVNPEDAETFINEIDAQTLSITNHVGDSGRPKTDYSFDKYLQFRRLTRTIEILDKIPKSQTQVNILVQREKELRTLLQELKYGESRATPQAKTLLEIVEFEEELRRERPKTIPASKIAMMTNWASKVGDGSGDIEVLYRQNLLIAWRAVLDYVEEPILKMDSRRKELIEKAVEFGRFDQFTALLLNELKIGLNPNKIVTFQISVHWGDIHWPTGISPAATPVSKISVVLPSDGSRNAIAKIEIGPGDEDLIVSWASGS